MPARAQAPVEAEGPSHHDDSDVSSDAPNEASPPGDPSDPSPPGQPRESGDASGTDGPSSESSAPSRPRVGVMVLAVSPEDAALAEGLGEVLLAAIAGRDALRLVGKEEIQAALGHDDAASLGCLAALATSEETAAPASARVVLTVEPRHATVRIDGVEVATSDAIELSPGAHRLEVRAEGFVSVERSLELAAGERRDVDVALASIAPPPPPDGRAPVEERRAPWTVIAIASGGVAVGAGALALGLGVRSQRDVDEGLTRAEALAQVAARRRDARIANASWVVGSVALATAAVTAVLAWRGRDEGVALVPLEGGALASFEVRR